MLVNDLFEASMSDLADLRTELDQLDQASVDWDLNTKMIFLSWKSNMLPASAVLRFKGTDKEFRSRLYAAAASNLNKKPKSWQHALSSLKGAIRHHAISILSDKKHWSLIGGKWQGQRL